MRGPLELVVLVSGAGSNLEAILQAIDKRLLNARVKLVISNVSAAYALERAKRFGVETAVIPHGAFNKREDFERALVAAIAERVTSMEHTWVVLAGFMRVLTDCFLEAFPMRVVNLHPSILPAFPGAHAIEKAYNAGVAITGCTVHVVDSGVDTGPILAQAATNIEEGDGPETIADKIHQLEHVLLPKVLNWIATGHLTFAQGKPRLVGVNRAMFPAAATPSE